MGMTTGLPGIPRADINVTPLIDVLLVLLIIFMTVAPITPRGLNALLPQPPVKDQPVRAQVVVLTVRAGGQFSLNQEPLALADLGSRLHRIFELRGDTVVFVRGEAGLEFRDVARAIDVARGAGLTRVALMTTP